MAKIGYQLNGVISDQLIQPLKAGKRNELIFGGPPMPESMPSVCMSIRKTQPHFNLSDKHYICHFGSEVVKNFSAFSRARHQV